MKNFKWDFELQQYVYTGDLTKNTNYLIRVCEKVVYWFSKESELWILVIVDVRGDIVEHFHTQGELAAWLTQNDLLD